MSNKSITEVLADGLAAQVSGRGRLCCEESQLTANEAKAARDNWMAASRRAHRAEAELARRNEELSEVEEAISALTSEIARIKKESQAEIAALAIRAERAEDELGEWKQTAANALQERDLSWWGEVRLKSELDELQAKLDAAEGWPDWLGSRPVLRVPVRKADGNWTFHDGNVAISGDVREETCRDVIKGRLAEAVTWAGVLSAIESEQAATGDEDQRVEEQAKALRQAMFPGIITWDGLTDRGQEAYRAAIRAGWTPPNNPV